MVVGCLIGLALALLLVGLVSGTVLRHIVQIVPIMVALAVVRRRPNREPLSMTAPRLYIFSGLPGSGKTTVSEALARHLGATHLRIDTIEQALRDLCSIDVQGEGYRLAYRLALENLRLGNSVVADSCNPIELTRREWEQVAAAAGAPYINIEIICSDSRVLRRRIESRRSTVPNLKLPTWEDVTRREYDPWTADRVVLDTSNRSEVECLHDLLAKVGA